MKKIRLKPIEKQVEPFTVLGISSLEQAYSVAWFLNETLSMNLSKTESVEVEELGLDEKRIFTVYLNKSENGDAKIILISNRSKNGTLLHKRWKSLDYFLWFDPPIREDDVKIMLSKIRKEKFIRAVDLMRGFPATIIKKLQYIYHLITTNSQKSSQKNENEQ